MASQDVPTPQEASAELSFTGVGDNDQVIYTKADFCKICRLNESFSVAFYQMDYSAIANAITGKSTLKPSDTKLMPVSKIVFDRRGFNQFLTEVARFAKMVGGEKNALEGEKKG